MDQIQQAISAAVNELFKLDVKPIVERTNEQFGDFSSNIALILAKKLQKSPLSVAEQIAKKLAGQDYQISVAGLGFLNFRLSDDHLWRLIQQIPTQNLTGKTIVCEYSDPNPFKPLHAGHLYTTMVGDAIANLAQAAGAKVLRVNFGGDVGRHVAITMWALINELGGEDFQKLDGFFGQDVEIRAKKLGKLYASGTQVFDQDDQVKQEVAELNKRVYQIHSNNDHDSDFAKIYWTARQWSYDYFDAFYQRIGTKFDKFYPESAMAPLGLATVQEQMSKGVYEQSDGAVVFRGEKYDLHTRVFINSDGLPTYEAKDVGLIFSKWNDYKPDISIIITANEIAEYIKVVLKSIEQFAPQLVAGTRHITHGLVKLAGGLKMSSRKGNVLLADDIIKLAGDEVKQKHSFSDESVQTDVVFGSIRYAFVKNRIGGDIIYDPKESVSLDGNSGPYLQYALARANSLLNKLEVDQDSTDMELQDSERSLLRKIGEFKEVVDHSVADLMPHHICAYLYELAQVFNHFYEKNRVVGDERQVVRTKIVQAYAKTLKRGLEMLNIPTPEKI